MEYNTGKAKWEHGQPMVGHNEWHRYLGPCPNCGSLTFDYGGGWRCLDRYCGCSYTNPAPNVGPAPSWWNSGINVIKDGNQWMAHGPDFINLQESNVGFGDRPDDAVKEYLKEDNLHPIFKTILKPFFPCPPPTPRQTWSAILTLFGGLIGVMVVYWVAKIIEG